MCLYEKYLPKIPQQELVRTEGERELTNSRVFAIRDLPAWTYFKGKKRSNVLMLGWISQEEIDTEGDLLASPPCDSQHLEMLASQVLW